MPDGVRLSARQLRDQAVRWRALATEATTPQTKSHLLKLAQQSEFLASGLISTDAPPIGNAEYREAELPDAAG
jgi:hypothetical protein